MAKDGLKLQTTVEGRPGPRGLRPGDSRQNVEAEVGELSGSGITIARLIGMLAPQVGRPIIDRTNLTGLVDFELKFAPQQTTLPPRVRMSQAKQADHLSSQRFKNNSVSS